MVCGRIRKYQTCFLPVFALSVMGGKPCIRGMRVKEDILQALRYAAALSQWHEVSLAADIDKGALVTIDPRKTRVTLLPL
jgi:hypothetical protein